MSEVAHPTAVVIPPPCTYRDRHWTPAMSERFPVEVQWETAPDTTVDYSAFHGVGRDATHATPHIWRYQALAIADKLSIAAWPFQIRQVLGAMVVRGGQPRGTRVGGMNPTLDSSRVIPPTAASLSQQYGSRLPSTFAPQYAKIM